MQESYFTAFDMIKGFWYFSVLWSDQAKLIVSLLRDMQEIDQRTTMLQLVDKVKVKLKNDKGMTSC